MFRRLWPEMLMLLPLVGRVISSSNRSMEVALKMKEYISKEGANAQHLMLLLTVTVQPSRVECFSSMKRTSQVEQKQNGEMKA